MKLSVSNIAWPIELDSFALEFIAAQGIRAIEVAPTRVWPHWQGISTASVREFRSQLESGGLKVSSLQSIFFHKPELQLFGSDEGRRAMYEHLCCCADLAVDLGAACLVFGAPRNRDRGERSESEAFAVASDFFSKVAEYYLQRSVALVFEANPVDYGCNFATESKTAAALVRAVNSPGFRLHLDIACMQLAGESDPVRAIAQNIDILGHFHASEPNLGQFAAPATAHILAAQALNDGNYQSWVALEMRAGDPPLPALQQAIRYFEKTYGVHS
jgi:D-psicose/D-tagatose/L-ribulose 3-epimerase